MSSYFDKVYQIVKTIPKGKVMTYGQIAGIIGQPRNARIVGWALHVNPDSSAIPCHRVINSNGRISSGFAFGGPDMQRKLLEDEGIIFENDGRIELERYLYEV